MSSIEVELARTQWDRGSRALEAESRDRASEERLLVALEIVTDELRRRIGQTFTIAELARVYAGSDDWVRDALSERAPFGGWPRLATTVQDAAFHLYARGATDYVP